MRALPSKLLYSPKARKKKKLVEVLTNMEDNGNKAIAVLIENTRTTKRHISLIAMAKWIDVAIKSNGNINSVAETISLSPNMLRQFLYVKKLSKDIQALFADRKIDSVDAAVHLSMLEEQDQKIVSKEMAEGKLTSAELRAIREFRKEVPDIHIYEIIEKVKSTQDIKQYIAEFVVRSKKIHEQMLKKRFAKVIELQNIVSLTLKGPIGRIVMSKNGKNLLQKYANERDFTKAKAISSIVHGEID